MKKKKKKVEYYVHIVIVFRSQYIMYGLKKFLRTTAAAAGTVRDFLSLNELN